MQPLECPILAIGSIAYRKSTPPLLNRSDGTIELTPVKAEAKERFPRGSLIKYCTPERDLSLIHI